MSVTTRRLYVPDGDRVDPDSVTIANAMAVELLRYGILVRQELLTRITRQDPTRARRLCSRILKMFTIGDTNPPLFAQWEERTEFRIEEIVVQICGYLLQVSGNDLADPAWLDSLKSRIDIRSVETLELATSTEAQQKFQRLVTSNVALDKASQQDLIELAEIYHTDAPARIKSAEARMAVICGMVASGLRPIDALSEAGAGPVDVLRYAAVVRDFESVKLPAGVLYATLPWKIRVQLLSFLDSFDFEVLCEAMGNNRSGWQRFFSHMHVLRQPDFRNRFPAVVAAALLSTGWRVDAVPDGRVTEFLDQHVDLYELTAGGNLAFRTFASRIQSAISEQDFERFSMEISRRPGYLLRNIGSCSNVCTPETEEAFVELVRNALQQADPGVLLSIIQIDVDAEYRIIDSKGNTTVTEADYSPVIGRVQQAAADVLRARFGVAGQIAVDEELKKKVVPFLSTNAELDRGSRISFDQSKYVYFLLHWVQQDGRRTDLDHSYVCFDRKWRSETVYFGNQANAFIKQSGDITNAPAPHGGTEYGRIDLQKIPQNIRYIVPIVNVYSGDVFCENQEAYAGFLFSDRPNFSIAQDHVRYDLSQPAHSNIPFVIDVSRQEIIIVDFNNRRRNGWTAHSSIADIQKVISAVRTKKFMTIERFAQLLSGTESQVTLTITRNAKCKSDMEPADLQSLVS